MLNEFYTFLNYIQSHWEGFLAAQVLYVILQIADARRYDKMATRIWCNTDNKETLKIFYPRWWDTIKGMFPRIIFRMVLMTIIYVYVSRVLNYYFH